MKDMINQVCKERHVGDCEFFINKRDYPQLKFRTTPLSHPQNDQNIDDEEEDEGLESKGDDMEGEVVEPYGFIFDRDDKDESQDISLTNPSLKFNSYTPIFSFYTSSRFGDIPFPTSEDWEAASGKVYPPSFFHNSTTTDMNEEEEEEKEVEFISSPRVLFTEGNFQKFSCEWSDKKEIAFFRGSCTGGGVKRETNQRLNLACVDFEWNQESDEDSPKKGLLDAKLVKWNLRDKKIGLEKMSFIRKNEWPFPVSSDNFVPIYEQSRYKYLIYVEGHCAACRYGFLMRLGSVILKVKSSCVADQIWYFPMLKEWVDHVPVEADLSDLQEKIEWCKSHDKECQLIAQRAKDKYDKYVSKEGILDYLEMSFQKISSKFRFFLFCLEIFLFIY